VSSHFNWTLLFFTLENAVELHSVSTLKLATTVGGNIQSLSQTWVARILWSCFHCSPFISVSFIANPKPFSCTAVTTQNTKRKTIISHAQNTTALHLNVFLIGIHRLTITKKQKVGFPPRRELSSSTEIFSVTDCIFVIIFFSLIGVEFWRINSGALTADETGLYYKALSVSLWRAMKPRLRFRNKSWFISRRFLNCASYLTPSDSMAVNGRV